MLRNVSGISEKIFFLEILTVTSENSNLKVPEKGNEAHFSFTLSKEK